MHRVDKKQEEVYAFSCVSGFITWKNPKRTKRISEEVVRLNPFSRGLVFESKEDGAPNIVKIFPNIPIWRLNTILDIGRKPLIASVAYRNVCLPQSVNCVDLYGKCAFKLRRNNLSITGVLVTHRLCLI